MNMKNTIFLFLLIISRLCYSQGTEVNVSFFYCDFDTHTIIPLHPKELIETADVIIKVGIEKSQYEKIIQEFQTMELLEPPSEYSVKKPLLLCLSSECEIETNPNDYEEINIPLYINTRLVIQMVNRDDVFTIAIGNDNMIEINGTLYRPNDLFKQKVTELLDLCNLDKIKSDFAMLYPLNTATVIEESTNKEGK